MAKKTAIEKKKGSAIIERPAAPAFLVKAEKAGLDEMTAYLPTTRLKIVQDQSDEEVWGDIAPTGSVVLTPDMKVVAQRAEPFIAIPVFFWVSWELWSDYRDNENPMIMEFSLDPTSPIAIRSRNPRLRSKVYDGQESKSEPMCYQYIESLNYALYLPDVEQEGGQPTIAISSWVRTGNNLGRQLNRFVKDRGVAIFGNRIAMWTGEKKESNAKGQWHRLHWGDPTEEQGGPWVQSEEELEMLQALHERFKTEHDAGVLAVVRDENDAVPDEDD